MKLDCLHHSSLDFSGLSSHSQRTDMTYNNLARYMVQEGYETELLYFIAFMAGDQTGIAGKGLA